MRNKYSWFLLKNFCQDYFTLKYRLHDFENDLTDFDCHYKLDLYSRKITNIYIIIGIN